MREQAYERPLAAGQLRYERAGQPTGAVESWRWSAAATDAGQGTPGYRILRVDLDARAAPSGHSYLYNLVQRENGRFEQLKYRFWANGMQLKGNVLLEDEEIIATREVNEVYVSEETAVLPGYRFWFPSSVGLGLVGSSGFGNERIGVGETADSDSIQTITLQAPAGEIVLTADPPWPLGLVQVEVERTWGRPEVVRVAGQEVTARPLTLTWSHHQRTVWLDQSGLILKMERDDGLTAVATRTIRYQG
ncbi:MAG: hypothetical protein R6X32_04810 [Chloroflexota bacterium]